MILSALKHGRPPSWSWLRTSTKLLTTLNTYKTHTRNSPCLLLCTRQSGVCRTYQTHVGPVKEEEEEEDKRFKVLFMGRDEFSCLVLQQLYEAKDVWKEIVIATQPDVHVGRRGSVLSVSPLKTLGEKLDIPVWTIPKVKKEFRKWELPAPFGSSPPPTPPSPPPPPHQPPNNHLLITASFGRILPARMLRAFPRAHRLNVHPSLVPAYRGPAPLQWTIVNGERESGVCVLEMMEVGKGEGIDAGGVWGFERVVVPYDATFEVLRDELAGRGGRLLVRVLRGLMDGTAVCQPQAPVGDAPKAPMISARDAFVDFSTMGAEDVWRRFRGIGHQKPVYAYVGGQDASGMKAVQFLELAPFSSPSPSSPCSETTTSPLTHLPSSPGSTILDKKANALLIRCADGTVLGVSKVKPEGKGERRAGEWWNGLGVVKSGERVWNGWVGGDCGGGD